MAIGYYSYNEFETHIQGKTYYELKYKGKVYILEPKAKQYSVIYDDNVEVYDSCFLLLKYFKINDKLLEEIWNEVEIVKFKWSKRWENILSGSRY